ncbi:hypothetical protein DsansV1_C05g0055111 [Dioscorea sansibarensis]
MLCCPLLTDQFTNSKAERREVSEKIKCLMGGEVFKKEIKVVRKALENAISVKPKGSSVKNSEAFTEDLIMHDVHV